MTPHITQEAAQWVAFVRSTGARFDVDAKADDALKFCVDARTRTFVVPSKLEGASRFQDNIAYAASRLDRFSRKLAADVTQDGRVQIGFGAWPLGFVRRKHEAWVRPLVESGYLCFWLHEVTGGAGEKRYFGVNVVIYNVAEAIENHAFMVHA